MAKFDKIAVLNKIGSTGMVPVFYHKDAEVAKKVVKACYDGGVRAFEFTNRGDFAQEVFAEIVKYAAKECPEMAIGIGSIVDPATAAMYLQLGAPGCGSVSEVGFAQEVGCDLCKVFPGDVYGTNFVKGLMAPMPWSKLMVTGGVEPSKENLTAWIKAGVFCVGMGSKLFPKDKVAAEDWAYVTAKCEEALSYIAEARKK